MRRLIPAAAVAAFAASPAFADPRPVVDPPASRDAAAGGVTVFVFNDDDSDATFAAPDRLESRAQDGTLLVLVPDGVTSSAVAAHGFVKLRYRLADDGGVASAPAPTLAPATASAQGLMAANGDAPPAPGEQSDISGHGSSSGFFDRIHAYEPIYGVWGANDAGVKLQFSFAAQPFGGDGALSHLRFAYTQQVYWLVNDLSGPVRSLTYSPELFFDVPVTPTVRIATGYRHDSNGGDVANSVDINRFYIKANKRFDLGHDWQLNVTPQVWYDFFKHGIAPDIYDYWGYAALGVSIEQKNGIKFALNARGNPATGRGGSEFFLSYPVKRLGLGDAGFYLFGQAFTGYGEQLIDYNRAQTRARIGIAFTR